MMENRSNLEKCTGLGTELVTSNFIDFQSPATSEDLAKRLVTRADAKSAIKNNQNALVFTQKSTKSIKSEGSSITPAYSLRRTSLIKLFDPLHSVHQNVKVDSEGYTTALFSAAEKKTSSAENANLPSRSLISLESPKKLPKPLIPRNLLPEDVQPVKKYTERYFRQVLKAQELRLQEEFSQKFSEFQAHFSEEDRAVGSELGRLVGVNKSYSLVLAELWTNLESLKSRNESNQAKLKDLEVEKKKLEVDIKTSKEDLCMREDAFSKVYKQFETARNMIKCYKENEELLQNNIHSMILTLDKKRIENEKLESQIEEYKHTAAKESGDVKKATETQVMILDAQLKKSQIKIFSLENDLQQAKLNSDELKNIYDDLMAKLKA